MPDQVDIDEHAVTVRLGGDEHRVGWDELAGVAIHTTADGPFVDDMFWILGRLDDTTVIIPSETEGADRLLDRLQQLPAFDNEAVIAASTCMEEGMFLCWRRG